MAQNFLTSTDQLPNDFLMTSQILLVVNIAGGVRQIRRDLATSRGGTIGKGGIANTPPGEGDALGNDVTVIWIMNNTLL